MKLNVLLDIDGVIANFSYGLSKYLNKNYGCNLNPYSEPPQYSFSGWGGGVDLIDLDRAIYEFIMNDGFLNLPVYRDALKFVDVLNKISNIYIVTARIGSWDQLLTKESKDKVRSNTLEWLENNNISTDNVHFTPSKINFCLDNGILYMIEDRLETAKDASKHQIETVLIDRRYNQYSFQDPKIHRVYNYKQAIEVIKNAT